VREQHEYELTHHRVLGLIDHADLEPQIGQ
jgi:hypothetical protein